MTVSGEINRLQSSGLIGRIWPREKIVLGMAVCKWMRQEIPASAESAVVRASHAPGRPELVSGILLRLPKCALDFQRAADLYVLLQGVSLAGSAWISGNLLQLDLSGCHLKEAEAQLLKSILAQACVLMRISFNGMKVEPKGLLALAHELGTCSAITHLDLQRCSMSRVLQSLQLGQFTALSHLNVSAICMESSGACHVMTELGKLRKLSHINISSNKLRKDVVWIREALAQNKALTHLNLQGCWIGPDGGKLFAGLLVHCTALKTLDLEDNFIGASAATELASVLRSCSALSELNLSQNELEPSGIETMARLLRSNTALRQLELARNMAQGPGISALAEALGACPGLTHLNLADNEMGLAGAEGLTTGLQQGVGVAVLDLANNGLHSGGAAALAAGVGAVAQTLRGLRMGVNFMEGAGVRALGGALRQCAGLRELDLSGNELWPEGAGDLGSAIEECRALSSLDVSWNSLEGEGAARVIAALGRLPAVERVSMRGNRIPRLEGMSSLQRLTDFDVSLNHLADSGVPALAKELRGCPSLRRLDISENGLEDLGCGYEELRAGLPGVEVSDLER